MSSLPVGYTIKQILVIFVCPLSFFKGDFLYYGIWLEHMCLVKVKL